MDKPEKPKPEKLYYSIGEVAQMLRVNTSLIRYWEQEFKAIKPKKNRNGNRLFTAKDIETLRYIYHLVKEEGHTLDGARKILSQKAAEPYTKYQAIETLQKLREFLSELRNEIH